jgi:3-hydroxyisobutyrate dehydrogenase
VRFVDAPVSGGVKRAVNGTLAIMVGGDKAVIDDLRPILSLMGTSLFHAGPIGAGHAMKALNNYVSAVGLLAACEAVEVARRFGIEPETAVDALNSSTGKNNSTENKMKPFVISGAFNSGFSLGLMHKDLRTALALAEDCGVDVPLASHVVAVWGDAEERLGFGADHTEIARVVGQL